MKLVGYEALFLALAIRCGFTKDKLVSIIIMLGSASTVTCFVMAKNMGHEGSFSSGVVLLTTLFSAFTLTLWLFICKGLGLIDIAASAYYLPGKICNIKCCKNYDFWFLQHFFIKAYSHKAIISDVDVSVLTIS